MKSKIEICAIIFGILIFISCTSLNYGTNDNSDDVSVYSLARNEKLSTFIEIQNRINGYAKLEHIPTDEAYKNMFISFEEWLEEIMNEYDREFPDEPEGSTEEFLKRSSFIYSILYYNYYRTWFVVLVGRSTTLYFEYSSNSDYARKNNLRSYNNLIPNITDWMDLNNIPSLDDTIRFNINADNFIIEAYGKPGITISR